MKTIYDLFREAKRENQGRKPALSDLLLCLIQTQDAREVDDVLEQCNLTRQGFEGILESFRNQSHPEDADIIISSIMDLAGNTSPSGWHLLAVLCRNPNHPISRALAAAGLDLISLQKILSGRQPA